MSRQKPHSRRLDLANAVEWDHPLNLGKTTAGWWPGVDGAGGRLTDICHATSCDGVLLPASSGAPVWTPTKFGYYGLSLNGSSAYVQTPLAWPASWSAVATILPTSLSAASTVFGVPAVGGSNAHIQLRLSTSGQLQILNASVASIGTSTSTVVVNQWWRIGWSYDVTTGAFTFFINGTPAGGSGTTAVTWTAGDTVAIGAKFTNQEMFTGVVADPRVMNKAMPGSWFAADYRHSFRGYTGPDSPIRWQRGRAWSYGIVLPPITATLNVTQAGDTLSAAGTVRVAAALSATQAGNTGSAAGTVAVAANLIRTQAGDTLAAAGSIATGASLTATLAGDTLAATGSVLIAATAALAQADQVIAAVGVVLIGGVLVATHAADTLAAAGVVTFPPDPRTYFALGGLGASFAAAGGVGASFTCTGSDEGMTPTFDPAPFDADEDLEIVVTVPTTASDFGSWAFAFTIENAADGTPVTGGTAELYDADQKQLRLALPAGTVAAGFYRYAGKRADSRSRKTLIRGTLSVLDPIGD